ncbi:MAG: hypothetical protein JWN20_2609, partial [Jatrophihabitantaceae bacterium]|nr:hypothetical protein [Jatrophihabitantaceae bacterium]
RLADERKTLVEAVTRARTQYRLCMEANGLPLDRNVSPADPR